MTSQINYDSIDGSYPIAGQNNDSSGFRNNFANIKTNFQYAYQEITALQANVGADNSTLSNVTLKGYREVLFDFGTISGPQIVDFSNGNYQRFTLGGSASISAISNWPATGSQVRVRIEIVVSSVDYTFTWPTTVSLNYVNIANISGRTITFTRPGTYIFELSSVDGGSNISIQDLNRNANIQQGNLSLETVVSGSTVTGITMTVSNIGGQVVGNITANNMIVDTLITSGTSATYTGNVTAGNLIAINGIYGNINTAIQSNITLLGTLSSLSVSGNANVGNLTVTGISDFCGGDSVGTQYLAPTTGQSVTINSNVGAIILNPSGTIASMSLTMPVSPRDGHLIRIGFGNTITSLTHVATGGQTLKGALTAGSTSAGAQYLYNTFTTTWYRIS